MTIDECAHFYNNFVGRTYVLTLENGLVVSIRFDIYHFKHLLGLEKLIDIPALSSMSATAVFKKLLDDEKLVAAMHRSHHFDKIADRLKYFHFINDLLHSKIIIDFDPSLVQGGTYLRSTDYILYLKKHGGYINFTIGGGLGGHYPETFFFERSKRYITDQCLLDIVDVKIME